MKGTTAPPPDDAALARRAASLGDALRATGATVATAESCTGGWIAKCFTDVAGSSDWFGTGVVSYANAAKAQLLGVPRSLIEREGAVSEGVVVAMAEGVRRLAAADWGVAVSGVAGPGGGTPGKPVGLVWLAWAGPGGSETRCCRFAGDRDAVRRRTVDAAIDGLLERATVARHR